MLTRSGAVKLMDFGLATTVVGLGDETRMAAGAFEGTPAFMAPEQLSNVPLDRRADVYAVACVAYTLLTGRSLFRGANLFELVQEKLSVRLPPASELGGGISGELHTFMTRALDANRETRLDSVRSLVSWAAPVDSALLNPA
jgi:serine/threonine-protein kinase